MKILHVMDCLGSILAIPAALSFLESYARDNRIDAADFSCTSPRINRFFVAGGWFSTVDELCFQFTHLFDPPELVTPPTTSITYWSNDESNDLMDQSRFYLTKGDLDLDRPTYRSYERTGRLPDSARH
jgi:hypothetical protein